MSSDISARATATLPPRASDSAPDSAPPAEHLEFQHTVEGLFFKMGGGDLTPELKAKLRAAGLDLDKALLPAYPAEDVHRWIRLAATHLWPQEPEAEAVRRFGQRTLTGLAETMVGRAARVMLMVLGVRRSLLRATRTFRSNNNYMDVMVHEHGATRLELVFNHVHGLPAHYLGVLEGAGVMLGAKNYRVQQLPCAAPGARYLVEWTE